jgi:hypothetical protein
MLTVVLTNYKRVENLTRIHAQLQHQVEKPRLFLWDNNPGPASAGLTWDVYVRSKTNLYCTPRWHLAKVAQTPYVAVMDDDLYPADASVLADSTKYLETHPKVAAIGFTGVILRPNQPYRRCTHIIKRRCPATDVEVHVIKGRFMVFRTQHIATFAPTSPDCEDMEASAHFSQFGKLVVPKGFPRRFVNLPAGSHSLASRHDHHERREQARRRIFTR